MSDTLKRSQNYIVKRHLSDEEVRRLEGIRFIDAGFGYDKFGLDIEAIIFAYTLVKPVYDRYFRVESRGHENIPKNGRAMVAGNHSGTIPTDAAMIILDILKKCTPPRIARGIVANYGAALPYIGNMLSRVGQVIGTRRNFEELLQDEDLVMIFPEGLKGIGKPYKMRYRLKPFNLGFIELSLKYNVPIIPTAVIGAEEQAPLMGNIKLLAKLLGLPFFPITPTFPLLGPIGAIPYPCKYRIYYGKPLKFYEEYQAEAARKPEILKKLALMVQEIVQDMIDKGLKKRKGVFF